jgi:hypothetical protein
MSDQPERNVLHPDGLPASATPLTDIFHDRFVYGAKVDSVHEIGIQEERARKAETCLYELAWERLGSYETGELRKTVANLEFELALPAANADRRPWTEALAKAGKILLKNRRGE